MWNHQYKRAAWGEMTVWGFVVYRLVAHTRTWEGESPQKISHFTLCCRIQFRLTKHLPTKEMAVFTCSGLNKQMWELWANLRPGINQAVSQILGVLMKRQQTHTFLYGKCSVGVLMSTEEGLGLQLALKIRPYSASANFQCFCN